MNWIEQAKRLFDVERPEHFTNFTHCDECHEHDQTLLGSSVDDIGLNELGNPGWDPICFCNEAGKLYYMPAFIRLSLSSVNDEFYFCQWLFHLEYDGKENSFLRSCSTEQRQFVADFIEEMINTYPHQLESNSCMDDALRVHQLWFPAA